MNYIKRTNNNLVKSQRKHGGEVWFVDSRIDSPSAKYLVIQIGHDVYDPGKTNERFNTDSWIWVDSLSHKLFEYDLTADSLKEWKR